ncbi:MAG TPA: hypothetical protein VH986_12015 [Acidimicrobiia bacterium]
MTAPTRRRLAVLLGCAIIPLTATATATAASAAVAPAPNGNAVPVLDPADGKVAVVASSAPASGTVAVVVQNGTARPVRRVRVSAIATSADGGLATRGATVGVVPSTLAPGATALGVVHFRHRRVPTGATITFRVRSARSQSADAPTALGTGDFVLSPPQAGKVAQTLSMTLTNAGTRTVVGPLDVVVVCFDEASRPAVGTDVELSAARVRAGHTRPVEVDLRSLCPTYLTAARGASAR